MCLLSLKCIKQEVQIPSSGCYGDEFHLLSKRLLFHGCSDIGRTNIYMLQECKIYLIDTSASCQQNLLPNMNIRG